MIKSNLKRQKKRNAIRGRTPATESGMENGLEMTSRGRPSQKPDFATAVTLARKLVELTGGPDGAKRLLDALTE